MKLIIGLLLLLLVIAIGGKVALDYFKDNKSISLPFSTNSSKAIVNNQTFKLYLADTEEKKQIGLSDKKDMPQDYGMLFEFDTQDYHSFWMKNMKLPIDILFLNNDKVISVYSNVQPPRSSDENLMLYKPEEPANKVLEINAGLAEKYNIKKGDTIKIEK